MPIEAMADGTVLYRVPLTLTDITVNGVSVLALDPIEAKVWPDGWGYVLTLKLPETGAGKTWVDGQQRNYTSWGNVEVTLP